MGYFAAFACTRPPKDARNGLPTMPKEGSAGGLTLHLRRRELLHPGAASSRAFDAVCLSHCPPFGHCSCPYRHPLVFVWETRYCAAVMTRRALLGLDGRDARPHTVFPGRILIRLQVPQHSPGFLMSGGELACP